MSENTFDAIVIGAGMSGSWVAKELCDRGIKTLLLERGRDVKHIKDYPTTNMQPWEFKLRGEIPYEVKKENPVISRCYAYREDNQHFFVKDTDHPYIQDKPFDWIRGYQVGGRSIMWARQTQRWSDYDFEGPKRDGFAVDWPIRYKDLEKWYDHVETFVGIAGNKDGIDSLPDGVFLPAWKQNCVENYFTDSVKKNYKDRHVIFSRCAHLSEPQPIHLQQGRTTCLSRLECERGCPFGGYFNANSSTIPWAERTGNLTLRPHSVVESILVDESTGKAKGVRIIDAYTKEIIEFNSKLVFLNAGSINSNMVLLNSKSKKHPNGLGNQSGLLGKYVAFHNYRARVWGICEEFDDKKTKGRKAAGSYIPRFRNVYKQETDFLRGYAAGFGAYRGIQDPNDQEGFGEELRDKLIEGTKLGPWYVSSHIMGETIPKESNYVALDTEKVDEWGMPLLRINIDYDDNDEKMIQDYFEQLTEMFEKAGFTNIRTNDSKQAPGLDIHVMGGARMGHDPETSILNKWNQIHSCQNVYVTDGACMTSTATQNPSLTYMVLAARAANYAADQIERENI